MEETLDNIKILLVVVLLEKRDLLLTLVEMSNSLMFITESAGNQAICAIECVKTDKSLSDATIQDSGIRERKYD